MRIGPLVITAFLFISLLGILLLKKASLEGKLILAFGALALAAYFRLHFYLLLLVSLSLFSFIGVSLFWAWLAALRLSLTRDIKDEAMAGENVPIRYKVGNLSILPLYHVRIWDRAFRERADGNLEEMAFEEPGYIGLLSIRPRQVSDDSLHFVPPVRGLFKFGPIAVEGGDPFGIFTLIKWLPVPDQCLVLPSWVILNALPSIPARLGTREQEHMVSKEGHSHEFLGIRPYSDGDSLRGIHWPLTAKHDRLIVRQFQREVEEEMLIILDADRRGDVGEGAENSLEYLITLALSLANAASDMGRPWNLVIAGPELITITHNAKESLLLAQHALAGLQAARENPIEELLDDLRGEFQNAACILLTPRTDSLPAVALSQGDAKAGGGMKSLLIRVDPSSFAGLGEGGIETLKRLKKSAKAPMPSRHHGPSQVTEITISRGDNIEDLFISHAFA